MKTILLKAAICFSLIFATLPLLHAQTFKKFSDKKVTYLVVNDINSPIAQKYFKVLQENWKITSKVELLATDALSSKKTEKGTLFISTYKGFYWRCDLDCFTIDQFSTVDGEVYGPGQPGSLGYFVLPLRHPTEPVTYMDGVKAQHDSRQTQYLGGKSPFEVEDNMFYTWGTGVFKAFINQYQYRQSDANKKPEDEKEKGITINRNMLAELSKETLYIPDEFFCSYNVYNNKSKCKPEDATKVMGSYPWGYKVLSGKEMNEKLLTDTKGFYYATGLMLRDNELSLQVIYSKTGETVYARKFAALFVDGGMFKAMMKDLQK
jgi:hypothetical protein